MNILEVLVQICSALIASVVLNAHVTKVRSKRQKFMKLSATLLAAGIAKASEISAAASQ